MDSERNRTVCLHVTRSANLSGAKLISILAYDLRLDRLTSREFLDTSPRRQGWNLLWPTDLCGRTKGAYVEQRRSLVRLFAVTILPTKHTAAEPSGERSCDLDHKPAVSLGVPAKTWMELKAVETVLPGRIRRTGQNGCPLRLHPEGI